MGIYMPALLCFVETTVSLGIWEVGVFDTM